MTKRKYVYVVREKNDWLDHIMTEQIWILTADYRGMGVCTKSAYDCLDDGMADLKDLLEDYEGVEIKAITEAKDFVYYEASDGEDTFVLEPAMLHRRNVK